MAASQGKVNTTVSHKNRHGGHGEAHGFYYPIERGAGVEEVIGHSLGLCFEGRDAA